MKICIKCGDKKDFSEYYGVQGDCKECTKQRVRLREEKKRKDPEWVKKEQARQREKYSRLGYKDKQKEWDKNKPWKSTAKYKNLSRKFKTPKGVELHHWNYKDEFLEDVFLMDRKQHRQAHKLLILELDLRIFRTLEGKLLISKEDHLKYLISKGIKI